MNRLFKGLVLLVVLCILCLSAAVVFVDSAHFPIPKAVRIAVGLFLGFIVFSWLAHVGNASSMVRCTHCGYPSLLHKRKSWDGKSIDERVTLNFDGVCSSCGLRFEAD